MYIIKTIILILSFSLLTLAGFSQKVWSLEDCINHALENNMQIKIQQLNSDLRNNQLVQSKADIFPSLNAGTNQNVNFGRSVDPFTNEFTSHSVFSTNFSVNSGITLFSGFQKYNTIERNKYELISSQLNVEQSKNDITLFIMSAYLNILFNIELLQIAKEQIKITVNQLSNTQQLVSSGVLSKQNIYEIEAQLATEELETLSIQNTMKMSLFNLAQFLELENYEDFEIIKYDFENTQIESSLLSARQIYYEALRHMPQIENSSIKVEIAHKNLLIAKGSRLPRLNLNVSYGTGYSDARQVVDQFTEGEPVQSGFRIDDNGNHIYDIYQNTYNYSYKTRPFFDQLKDNASAYVSLGLSIPIFNGLQTKTNIANNTIIHQQSVLQANQEKKELLKEIQQLHSDAQFAYTKYRATQKTLQAVQTSFEYSEHKFNLGVLNFVVYSVAKNNLTKIQSELIRAKYDFIFKQKILDFYRGIEIKLSDS
jgi:outer membrane protein